MLAIKAICACLFRTEEGAWKMGSGLGAGIHIQPVPVAEKASIYPTRSLLLLCIELAERELPEVETFLNQS